jgi:drug/metabolite transporter (DMT)-like permease
MEPQHIKANIQIIAASVIYGFSGIFFMYVKNMTAGAVVFYQLFFGLLALAGYLAVTGKLSGIRLRGKRKNLILLGAFNAGAMVSYYMAVSLTNVSISVLLLYTAPFYVLLLAPVFLKEKHNKKSLVALILSLAGVVMVIGPKNLISGSGIDPGYLSGVLMGLFSGLFYACVTITSRYLRNEYSGLEQLFISTLVMLLLLLPFVYPQAGRGRS